MKKIILILILTELLISCQQKKKTFYYNSGELWYELTLANEKQQIYHCRAYFKNGKLKEEGTTNANGLHIGHWKQYYSDGVLKWEGNFDSDGKLIISENGKWPNFAHTSARLDIKGNPKVLKLGKTYRIRIFIKNIHPTMYIVVNQYFKEIQPNNTIDKDIYPYIITPHKTGNFYIMVIFPNKDGLYLIGNSSIVFKMNVVK